jgi:hypothetical protein
MISGIVSFDLLPLSWLFAVEGVVPVGASAAG